MEFFNQIIENEWVVGIGAGVISGFIVFFATRNFVSRIDKNKRNQKIYSANREIMHALMPGVSEKEIPEKFVLESMISATARKYDLNIDSLYGIDEISEDLIKEVMDSTFVSSESKKEICLSIEKMMNYCSSNLIMESDVSEKQNRPYASENALSIGAISAMAAGFTTSYTVIDDGLLGAKLNSDVVFQILVPVAMIYTAVAAMYFVYVRRRSRLKILDMKIDWLGKPQNVSDHDKDDLK